MAAAACLLVTLFVSAAAPAASQEARPRLRRAVVTFDGRLEALPRLAPADFEITSGKQRFPPARLYAPAELPTLIALVFEPGAPVELPPLDAFIRHQPANTYVGLFYLEGDAVLTASPFDSDLAKVTAALRPPAAVATAPSSPDAGLARLLHTMEALPPARKEVLLLAQVAGAGKAVWAQSTEAARQTGIPIWVIPGVARETLQAGGALPGPAPEEIETTRGATSMSYARATMAEEMACDSLMRDPAFAQALAALAALARRSGGKALGGSRPVVDLRPGLDELRRLLDQQFLLEFTASEPPARIRTVRKVAGAKLLALQR